MQKANEKEIKLSETEDHRTGISVDSNPTIPPYPFPIPGGSEGKNPPAMWETWVQSLGQTDPLEKAVATHSTILALENPMDRGAWWDTVHGVTKSQT